MPTLTFVNATPLIWAAVRDTLRRALQKRATAATVSELRSMTTQSPSGSAMEPGALVYVTAAGYVYEWDKTSTSADNGSTTIKPDDVDGAVPGRWSRTSSMVASGTVERVLMWRGERRLKEFELRFLSATPSIGVIWEDSNNDGKSTTPGAIFDYPVRLSLWFFDENLRPDDESSIGSDWIYDVDEPGALNVLGRAKKVLADQNKLVTGKLGLGTAVKNILFGAERPEDFDLNERQVIVSLEVTINASIENPDDAVTEHREIAAIDVQPALASMGGTAEFDDGNYVVSGFRVIPGAGLTQTPTAGSAYIEGALVTSTPGTMTFSAWSDTYHDLAADGTLTPSAVGNGLDAPDQADGTLRVGRTITDGTDVVGHEFLVPVSAPFGEAFQAPQP